MTTYPSPSQARTVPPTRLAFTLVELLVTMAIIAVLVAILLPVFLGVRERARRTTCLSNLRQVTMALSTYSQDNAGYFPPELTDKGDWAGTILIYAPAKDVFRCPSCPVPAAWETVTPGLPADTAKGYALNDGLYGAHNSDGKPDAATASEAQVRFPSSTVSVCEFAYRANAQAGSTGYPSALSGPDDGTELMKGDTFIGTAGALRHQGGSNYAFVDGHALWQEPKQVKRRSQGNDGNMPSFGL